MLRETFEMFEIVPDRDLELLTPGQSLTQLIGRMLIAIEPVLAEEKPDLVLVHGDTATCFGTSIACFHLGIPVAHIEAGLRSGDIHSPFPEEFHRRTVGMIASYHFAPTVESRDNLIRDGVRPERIFLTGSTVVDAMRWVCAKVRSELSPEAQELERDQPLVIVTLHRRETGLEQMSSNLARIGDLARRHPRALFLYPVHPSPAYRSLASQHLSGITNVRTTEPLPYIPFLRVLLRASVVLTDSGGIQEEAAYLGKHVILLRDATERPEAVSAGVVHVIGSRAERLEEVFETLIAAPSLPTRSVDYGDGRASGDIADQILRGIMGILDESQSNHLVYESIEPYMSLWE
jgi:UDP-N-acetylglucosamine 2-epimerase (non-hydrolysing)